MSGGDDLYAKKKKSSSKARTTKVKKSRKATKSRKSAISSLPVVVLGTTGPINAPEPFVTLPQVKDAPNGLDGRTIALWPSHGKYFSGSWVWQRPRLFGTVEDLLSRSFVDPYIVPMLENAGAYVMMPRERDFSHKAIIIDHDWSSGDGRFATTNGRFHWEEEPDSTGFGHHNGFLVEGENPFLMGASGKIATIHPEDSVNQSTAEWYGTPLEAGNRAVYVSYQSYPNSATDAVYTINHLGGSSKVTVNQRMGGGTWVYIGTYPFPDKPGKLPLVSLSNISADDDAVVSADAVKIGGGMGQVARSRDALMPGVSGFPAFLEGARYYIQSAGFPQEVYSPNKGENDYMDDYMSRALWVNWLTGASEMLPDSLGLRVPIDMVLAFHTDAGIKPDSTTVGTLGLYSTDGGNPLGNGTSRYANRDLTAAVTTQVVNDIRQLYNPNWSSRNYFDRRYYEIRETKVPAMIIELLSHQNFEDMKHAHDPHFRFIVGRAVYKGILRFLAERYDQPYTVQPLPVEAFAILPNGNGSYTLKWEPTLDPIEPSAKPTCYFIYEATAENSYRPIAKTTSTEWTTQIDDDKIHAYYVVAGNDGGISFPSEILTLYDNNHRIPSVEIVNGYTRISAPEWTDGTTFAGFDFSNNYGVPDRRDIHFIGPQYDFDPTSTLAGDALGFGASSDTEATKARYGNSRDYTIVHGEAMKKAGRGFVSSSLKAFVSEQSTPKAVDLILGLQKSTRRAGSSEIYFQTFPKALRDRLTQYRSNGGTLLVSGSHLASEIIEADSLSRDTISLFAADILGYRPYMEGVNDSLPKTPIATLSLEVKGCNIISGMPILRSATLSSFANSNWAGAGNPQAILPADDNGLIIARYSDTNNPAVIAVEGKRSGKASAANHQGRTVVASFPLEAINEKTVREDFIAGAINFLIGPETPPQEISAPTTSPVADPRDKRQETKKKDKKKATAKQKKENSTAKVTTTVKDNKAVVPKPVKKQSSGPKAVPHRRK